MKVMIEKSAWEVLRREALISFPNECVGFFIGYAGGFDGSIKISDIRPCRNMAKDSSILSSVSKRDTNKVLKECDRLNKKVASGFFVGQYHSHPVTGNTGQSQLDKSTGKRWKAYRHQLIMGLRSTSPLAIRKKFHYYDRKAKTWKAAEIVVGKNISLDYE